jgi:hypothetical protein
MPIKTFLQAFFARRKCFVFVSQETKRAKFLTINQLRDQNQKPFLP